MRPPLLILLVPMFLSLVQRSALAETTLTLWPKRADSTASSQPEIDTTKPTDDLVAGKRVERLGGVTNPTITLYPASSAQNSHAAIVVFPGGGYRILAWDLEGTEVCGWLNSAGVNCVLMKYRVPDGGPYPKHSEDLADAQRALRLTRQHAAEWNIAEDRVGVLGFSAGGHLAAVLSNQADTKVYEPSDAADRLSARPDFAILIYPAYLAEPPERVKISPEVTPTSNTPPTFLVQAEDDPIHVENALVYYAALCKAKVPAEMHVFAQGRHGYGLRHTAQPVTDWPQLAARWLETIHMIGPAPATSSR